MFSINRGSISSIDGLSDAAIFDPSPQTSPITFSYNGSKSPSSVCNQIVMIPTPETLIMEVVVGVSHWPNRPSPGYANGGCKDRSCLPVHYVSKYSTLFFAVIKCYHNEHWSNQAQIRSARETVDWQLHSPRSRSTKGKVYNLQHSAKNCIPIVSICELYDCTRWTIQH